jgi:hypothetical protein
MLTKITISISEEPAIINLLSRMPTKAKESFTEEQLPHLRNAILERH